jgi:AcrR family transcriptional regulator
MSELRHRRADAQRNRDKLLAAARAAFAEEGVDAPLDSIAKRAGVGNATLYRHFPTRDDLLLAVFMDRVIENATFLERARQTEDPWAGFTQYIQETCRALAADRGMADVMAIGYPTPELHTLHARASKARIDLIERAKASGQLRADATPEDVVLLLLAVAGIIQHTGTAAPAATERYLSFALDGFRAPAATPAPPPISRQKIRAALRRRHRSTEPRANTAAPARGA